MHFVGHAPHAGSLLQQLERRRSGTTIWMVRSRSRGEVMQSRFSEEVDFPGVRSQDLTLARLQSSCGRPAAIPFVTIW